MQHVGDEPWQSQAPPDPAAQPPASRARVELQQSSGGGGSGGGGQALSSLSPPPLTASSSSPGRPLDGWGQAELQRAQASPRSPSRLRAALHSRATRTAEGGQGLQNTGDAACFLRVEQVEDGPAPTAARQQEDVCIEHIKPDGVRHAAQVEAGIIHQVDGLVNFFTQQYSQDEATIEQLEQQLAQAQVLAAMRAQQMQAPEQHQLQPRKQQHQRQETQQQQQQQAKQRQPLLEQPGSAPVINTGPGTLHFVVLYASLYARFLDTFVAFDNAAIDVAAAIADDLAAFTGGVVARGACAVAQGGVATACRIGPTFDAASASIVDDETGSSPGAFSCSPAASCTVQNSCFGALCDFSRYAVVANTTYKVVAMTELANSSEVGPPLLIGSFHTAPATGAPRPHPGLRVDPVISFDRFAVDGVGQDQLGFVYVIVTRPAKQRGELVLAGTATNFSRVAALRRLSRRSLQAANVTFLPPEAAPLGAGTAFLPTCPATAACSTTVATDAYVDTDSEQLVRAECTPVARISDAARLVLDGLANDTLYRVTLLTSTATAGLHAGWGALLRTQDATPPVLSVLDSPAPGFTAFDLAVSLNEPGLVNAALHLAGAEGPAPAVTCPPAFQVPPLLEISAPVAAGGAGVVLSFAAGLTPNTDYTVTLIARDTAGNCQRAFTRVPVHTADNAPPVTLALRAANVTGSTAQLRIALDEPGIAFYSVARAAAAGDSACPPAAELFALGAGGGPGGRNSSVVVPARSPVEAVVQLRGLASETTYAACVVAYDATSQHNRQTTRQRVAFTTLDVTPPTPTLAVAPAGDGGDVACSRVPPYLCNLTWSAALSEPGAARWALARNGSWALPLPAAVLMADVAADSLFPNGAVVAEGSLNFPPSPSGPINLTGLDSGIGYVLVLAARDAATPTPNIAPALVLRAIIAPDVTPPVFLEARTDAATDTSLDLAVRLDEDGTTFFVLVPHPSDVPTVAEVLQGVAAGGAAAAATNSTTSAANATAALRAAGLQPGQLFDAHLAAVDAAGNRQLNVTTLSRVRTTDSTPPSITAFTATWTPPMSLVLSATVTKPGVLRYLARRTAEPAPAESQAVLAAVAANDLAAANFTGSLAVPAGGVPAGGRACVADGGTFVVYAVAQDGEGDNPGRWPNNSTLSSAPVMIGAPASSATCNPSAFLSALRPTIVFDGDGPGLALGHVNVTTDPASGTTTWTQAVGAFTRQPATPQAVALARVGSIPLPGSASLAVTNSRPAAAAAVVCSDYLVPGDSGATGGGGTLRMSYQLRDARGRTAVDTSGLLLHPQLSYASAAALPAGVNATINELPSCDARSADPISGIGECSVVLDSRYFPASGSVAATVSLQLRIGTAVLGASPPAGLQLAAAPARTPFTPSSPGLLMTLPARALHMGETVVVSLAAVNPRAVGLTSWSVPLRYDSSLLELAGVVADQLWLDAATSDGGLSGRVASRTIRVAGRAPGQRAARYRSSSTIPLAQLEFLVRMAAPGTYPGALTVGAGVLLESGSSSPTWAAPPVGFYDHRGGLQVSGSVNVTATRTLGLWAWPERGDVFNTAALDGARVTTQLRAATVRSWGSPAAVPVAPTSCGIAAASAAAAATALSLDAAQCAVHVDAVNTGAVKDATFALGVASGSASAVLSVWQPSNASVEADDPTLNSMLPLNAGPTAPGCSDHYQSTRLRARADWSNGGGGPGDTIAAADVTPLSTFAANDSTVVLVLAAVARGVGPGTASIGLLGFRPAGGVTPAAITVTDAPVCLVALEPLATTGVAFVGPLPTPPYDGAAQLSWRAAQQLDWEDSEARVMTIASFSDGSSVDVSDRALLWLRQDPDAASPVSPFALAYDTVGSPFVRVNASVAGAGPIAACGAYLQASWEVCARPLGGAQGRLTLALPGPTSLAGLAAAPATIASPGDPAAQPPLSLPPSSALGVEVVFGDGSRRDFSSDARTSFAVAAGATLCQVARAGGSGNAPWEATTAPGGDGPGGACRLTASVAFAGAPPLTADIGVEVVALRSLPLFALPPTQLSEPPLPPASGPLGPMLRLLRCDGRNFDQATLWPAAVLSNCTGALANCSHYGLANREWVTLSSSDDSVFRVMRGYPSNPDYATFPLLDNRLVPLAPGSATLSLAFGNATDAVAVEVADTYQPTWPRAGNATDTAVQVSANMSAGGFAISVRALPSAGLDLGAEPASAASVVREGSLLAADPGGGAGFYAGAATGLSPGTNYTLLMAVGSGLSLSSGVTALVGALVPDTAPPSFTAASVSAAVADPSGSIALTLDVGLDEGGTLAYAAYPAPCLAGDDPSEAELRAGATINSSCAPTAHGLRVFPSTLRETVTLTGALPPSPYEPLRAWTSDRFECPADAWEPPSFTPRTLALYLLASDDAPGHHTYRGWTSECAAPAYDTAAPAGPCEAVTVVPCNNTQYAPETFNAQPLPFRQWDSAAAGSAAPAPAPPPGQPLRVPVTLTDATPVAFTVADVSVGTSGGRSLVFTFAVTRPSLVRYTLVRNVVERVAWGLYPVFDAATNHTVVLGRDCVLGSQLSPGTAYGIWYNATDVYSNASPWRIISAPLLP